MIPAFLLLLALAYLAALAHNRRRGARPTSVLDDPRVLSLSLSLVGAAGVFLVLVLFSDWRGATQMAWVGLRTLDANEPLQIGGNDQGAVAGWPNESLSPMVRVEPDGSYVIGRGGAFLSDADGNHLNGEPLVLQSAVTERGLTVALERWWYFWRAVSIRRSDGSQLARLEPRRAKRHRVLDLETAVQDEAAKLRASGEPDGALELERWAQGLRLLVPASRWWSWGVPAAFRLLGRDREYSGQATLPVRWTVSWTTASLPLMLRRSEGRLAVDFLPPWRLASPLPSAGEQEQSASKITLTSRPLPGDVAFVLPFASSLATFRADLPMANDRFTDCLEQRATSTFGPRPVAAEPTWEAVTCTSEVEAARVAFRVATVRDLPRAQYLATTLLLPLALMGWGLWLCLERLRLADQWVVGGVVTSVWLILLYRWLLAFRYAADPGFLDPLAIKGVTLAALALALVPPVILVTARLWRDQFESVVAGHSNPVLFRLWRYTSAVATTTLVLPWVVAALWPNLPAHYSTTGEVLPLAKFAGTITLGLVGFWLLAWFEYVFNPDVRGRRMSRGIRMVYFAVEGGWSLLHSVVTRVTDLWRWLRPDATSSLRRDPRAIGTGVPAHLFKRRFGAACVMFLVVYLAVGAVAHGVPGDLKTLQDLIAPLLLCWIPAGLLIGSRLVFRPGSTTTLSLWRSALVVPAMVGLAVIALPIAVEDLGSMVATLSVFVPLSLLLLAGGRPFKFSALPICTLVAAVVVAATLYAQTQVMVGPAGIGETAGARVLLWKNGAARAQEALLWANVQRDGSAPLPVHYRRLSDAIEHAAENELMTHEGGWLGLGFGEAPTRRSRVPQDTLQYDSTFAFFVLGDSGLVGGVSLLLLFSIPLVLVLMSARPMFDTGHGLATVIAAAFWLSALAHASMNLGVLPFAGRNLPLLSVNSTTDLLLWAVLLGVMTQALLWRLTGVDGVWIDANASVISSTRLDHGEPAPLYWRAVVLVVSPAVLLLALTISAGVSTVRNDVLSEGFDWSPTLRAVNELANTGKLGFDQQKLIIVPSIEMPPDTVIGQEIALFNSLPLHERLDGTFPYGPIDFTSRLAAVTSLAQYDALMSELRTLDDGLRTRRRPSLFEVHPPDEFADEQESLPYAEPQYRVAANPAYNTRVSFRTGAQTSLPVVGTRDGVDGAFALRGAGIEIPLSHGPNAFERIVTLVGDKSVMRPSSLDSRAAVPSVRVELMMRPTGRAGTIRRRLLRASTTPKGLVVRAEDIDLQVRPQGGTMTTPLQREVDTPVEDGDVIEVPQALADGFRPSFRVERTSRGALVGPAWVRGADVMVYDPDPLVPWTRHFAAALMSGSVAGRTTEGAPSEWGNLTVDRGLQSAAQTLTSAVGRRRHESLLRLNKPSDLRARATANLPPRVALSVLALPSGEVRAIGGWPRMQSSRGWVGDDDTNHLPSSEWADERAPGPLRRRYGGDRNFDRLLMGSATKPIIAASVLAVHPQLSDQLAVRGPGGREHDVFGISVGTRGWQVRPSVGLNGGEWADFTSYTALSDNRFHIRLGFFGIADRSDAASVAVVPGARSPSELESMTRGRDIWHRYPRFPDALVFTHRQPNQIRSVHRTPLAERLAGMFGIGLTGDDRLRRYSFWTGDEVDDVPKSAGGSGRSYRAFTAISPEPPQFSLQRLERPRDFVSLLLGGDRNLWANVDFAGAFATAISGRPVIPHVRERVELATTREEFTEIAAKLRPGLEAVVTHPRGTAHDGLRDTGALAWLNELSASGYQVYAKTGTLSEASGQPSTSRIVLAIVRWKGDAIERGLVFSLVVERGEPGLATRELGAFLVENARLIKPLL